MSSTPAASRLRRRAEALALLYSDGRLTLAQLHDQMVSELQIAITAAVLSGTGSQRSTEIDRALRRLIDRDVAELDRLIALLENRPDMDPDELRRRLTSFTDSLPEAQQEGERLVERSLSPLIPIAIGAGLALLLGRGPDTGALPRMDSGQVNQLFNQLQQRLDALSDAYSNGELLPDDWHVRMQREIELLHRTLYRVGRGGNITPEDETRLNERIRQQHEFLRGFRDSLEGLTPEQIKTRARMYLANGQVSLQEGATARLGLPVLPAYPKDGSTVCLSNCRCTWDIQVVEGGYDCYWRLRPAEHCETCENRAALWSPIEVRNGVLRPYSTIGVFT